jgi:2-polyprenyl-3-methyl-5-hydroxy-6-metoxy-1,4-benzoquinol methylase
MRAVWRRRKVRGRGPVHRLNRLQKARMIEAVVSDFLGRSISGFRILDIGCGNGDISAYFARKNEQFGVDVSDRRRSENRSFRFEVVRSEVLPFDARSFDLVLSHHVIEHVGDQALHLTEIRRVLRASGVVYLATPNRSSPIMEGHVGNTKVLRYRQMEPLFRAHGYRAHGYAVKVLKDPRRFHGEIYQAAWIPTAVLQLLQPMYPSHIFVLAPQ